MKLCVCIGERKGKKGSVKRMFTRCFQGFFSARIHMLYKEKASFHNFQETQTRIWAGYW